MDTEPCEYPFGPAPDGLAAAVERARRLPEQASPDHLASGEVTADLGATQWVPRVPSGGSGPAVSAPPQVRRSRPPAPEVLAVALFALGHLAVGLLALLIGAGLVARSTCWDVREKVVGLLAVPLAGLMLAIGWAWVEVTRLNDLESSGARLRLAGESLAATAGVAVPLLGLALAGWFGRALVREYGRGARGV